VKVDKGVPARVGNYLERGGGGNRMQHSMLDHNPDHNRARCKRFNYLETTGS
jgi:hypothetical protein